MSYSISPRRSYPKIMKICIYPILGLIIWIMNYMNYMNYDELFVHTECSFISIVLFRYFKMILRHQNKPNWNFSRIFHNNLFSTKFSLKLLASSGFTSTQYSLGRVPEVYIFLSSYLGQRFGTKNFSSRFVLRFLFI